jgi:hypothetical protein
MVENAGICTIVPNGNKATITAKAAGETVIRVSHSRAENVLKITVRVGNEYIHNNPAIPYISASHEVVNMIVGAADTIIEAVLTNSEEASGFTFSVDRSSVAAISSQFSSGKCFLKPVAAGQAELTISHASAVSDKKIVLNVGNSPEEINGIKYLSTAQNVVTVAEGSSKTVSVSVKGSSETVISGYFWETSNEAVAGIQGIGATAQIIGNGIGSAILTVTQSDCPYPLQIIVMVIDPVSAAAHPYISTATSLYIVQKGGGWKTIEASLIGGSGRDDEDFLWYTPNTTMISLIGQGKTAMVKAESAGSAIVNISHPKAQYPRTIRLICEEAQATNCSISVPESIITLKPTDGEKKITAALVNGTEEDKYNFRWFLDTYDVVELNYSANVASIRPISQGQTTLHITHPKSAYEQQIIIKVSEYTTFGFGKDSETVTAGTVSFIQMQIPVTPQTTHVVYTTNSAAVVTITGTKAVAQLTGAGEGTAIVTAKLVTTATNAVQATAEMLVYCKKAESTLTYIACSTTVYTLEKGLARNISADIVGPQIIATDANNLQWNSSDTAVIKISGASTTGTAVGKQVNVQAVGAGECTVTISHDKSNSPLTLYFIVPATGEKEIMLNKTYITLETGSNTEIRATISNASNDDYASITWELSKVDGVNIGTVLGSGQTVAVYAQKPGQTKIRASLPNGKFAECEVLIQSSRQFSFNSQSIQLTPGETKTVGFTLMPEDATVNFTTNSGDYFTYTYYPETRTIAITGTNEGTAMLTGVTSYGNKGSLSVTVAWNYQFSLGKSVIQGEPRADSANPDKFVIPYTVNPADADITVELSNTRIATYVLDEANKKIILTPTGEGSGIVSVTAKNPNDNNREIGTKTCSLNFGYDQITLVRSLVSKTGNFSKYESSINELTLGDGEEATLEFSVAEPNVSYEISAEFSDPNSEVKVHPKGTNNQWIITGPEEDLVGHDYWVTKESYLTFQDTRLTIVWQRFSHDKDVYYRSPTGIYDSSGFQYYLIRTGSSVEGGIGNDEPFIGYSGPGFGVGYENYGARYEPTLVLVNTTPRRVSEAVFKDNTDYYIPEQEWANDTQYIEEPDIGTCGEYFINPADEIDMIDKTLLKENDRRGTVKVTVTHNGKEQKFDIPVKVETRYCSKDQQ